MKIEGVARFCVFALLLAVNAPLFAQSDTARLNLLDTLLTKPKGLIGQLTHSLLTDTGSGDANVQRNDQPFLQYENRIIRNVVIQSLEFGTLTKDTVRRLDKRL